METYDPGASVN